MKIVVTAKTGAREAKIEKHSDTEYSVWVNEQPVEGKANRAIIELLADHFGVAISRVRIVVGHTTKKKIVEII